MCLPNFEKFVEIEEANAVTGYRNWRAKITSPSVLISQYQDYTWNKLIEGPHIVTESDSGIYSFNNNYNNNDYNYYNNNYNNNNNYNYYNNNNNNNNYYYNNNYNNNYYYNNIAGSILQYGKVAIHKIGYRSEYAKIKTLYNIRESDASGPDEFISWITQFNEIIASLAKKYKCDVISWQDVNEKK